MSEDIERRLRGGEVATRGNWCPEAAKLLAEKWPTLSAKEITKLLSNTFPDRKFTRDAVIARAWRMGLPNQGAALRQKTSNDYRAPTIAKRAERLKAAPVMKVLGNNQTYVQADAAEPKYRVDWSKSYAPLPGSTPRPWLERRFGECNWPIDGADGETLSCCLPAERFGWCAEHVRRGRQPIPANRRNLARNLRRYVS